MQQQQFVVAAASAAGNDGTTKFADNPSNHSVSADASFAAKPNQQNQQIEAPTPASYTLRTGSPSRPDRALASVLSSRCPPPAVSCAVADTNEPVESEVPAHEWTLASVCTVLLKAALLLPAAPAADPSQFQNLRTAHRGGSAWGPENTLEAIQAAAARGVTSIEVDVWLTSDGIPVIIHDETVDRTSNGTGHVQSHTLEALQRLDVDPHPHRVARIPTLDAVLAVARDLGLKVELELKAELDQPQLAIEAIVALLKRRDMMSQVWVSSFDPRVLGLLRQVEPKLVCALGMLENATGDPFLDWALTSHWLPWLLGVSIIQPHTKLVDDISVAKWHQQGYVVNAWTANTAQEQARLAALGVGYTSNCPGGDCPNQPSDALQL